MIDSHTHLDLIDDDIYSIIARAKSVGVNEFIVPGVYGFPQKLDLLKSFPEVKICWGIFPKYAEEDNIFENKYKELMESDICVYAIGECGLDKRFGNIEKQISLFRKQINLSLELNLPLVIHLVGNYGKAYELLAESRLKSGFIMHSWTGSAQMAKEFVKLGGKISLSASILKNQKKLKEIFNTIPETSIIFETDSPDQKPDFWKEKYNEPSVLPQIIDSIKTLKNEL